MHYYSRFLLSISHFFSLWAKRHFHQNFSFWSFSHYKIIIFFFFDICYTTPKTFRPHKRCSGKIQLLIVIKSTSFRKDVNIITFFGTSKVIIPLQSIIFPILKYSAFLSLSGRRSLCFLSPIQYDEYVSHQLSLLFFIEFSHFFTVSPSFFPKEERNCIIIRDICALNANIFLQFSLRISL